MSDLVVETVAPPSQRRIPRGGARILMNALRVVTLVTSTFAALAAGIYFSSTSACKTPCRLDGSQSNRVAAVDAQRRGRIEDTPEQTGTAPRPLVPQPSAGAAASPDRDKEIAPPAPRRSDLNGQPLRPSVGMRTDLPRSQEPAAPDRWTTAVFQDGATR